MSSLGFTKLVKKNIFEYKRNKSIIFSQMLAKILPGVERRVIPLLLEQSNFSFFFVKGDNQHHHKSG